MFKKIRERGLFNFTVDSAYNQQSYYRETVVEKNEMR